MEDDPRAPTGQFYYFQKYTWLTWRTVKAPYDSCAYLACPADKGTGRLKATLYVSFLNHALLD